MKVYEILKTENPLFQYCKLPFPYICRIKNRLNTEFSINTENFHPYLHRDYKTEITDLRTYAQSDQRLPSLHEVTSYPCIQRMWDAQADFRLCLGHFRKFIRNLISLAIQRMLDVASWSESITEQTCTELHLILQIIWMMCNAQKGPLFNMQTMQAQISQRISRDAHPDLDLYCPKIVYEPFLCVTHLVVFFPKGTCEFYLLC